MSSEEEKKGTEVDDVPPPPYPGPPSENLGLGGPPQYTASAAEGTQYPPQGIVYPVPQELQSPPPPGYQYPPVKNQQYPLPEGPVYPPYQGQPYPTPPPHQYPPVYPGQYPPQAGYQAGTGYPPQQGPQVIQVQPLEGAAVHGPFTSEPKPQSYLILAVITCCCFSPIFGGVAIFCALSSDSAYKQGDVSRARKDGQTALILSIIGIAVSLVVMAVYIFGM